MADTKLSSLTAASALSGTELFYSDDGSADVKVTATQIKTFCSASPTLVTPTLGAATATSVNKVAITAPASSATLTIANGKTLTASNTLTFTGTDSSSVAFGAGGTVAYTALKLDAFAATTSAELKTVISDETGSGALVFANTPALVTPAIGAATGASLTLTGGLLAGTDVGAGAAGYIYWASRAALTSPSDGVILLKNSNETSFGSLIFGPSGTTYNRIKHNATGVLELRLADDSAQATWDALAYRTAGTKVVGTQGAAVADATDAASTMARLNDLLARLRTHGLIAT